jgi:hypothetical protein
MEKVKFVVVAIDKVPSSLSTLYLGLGIGMKGADKFVGLGQVLERTPRGSRDGGVVIVELIDQVVHDDDDGSSD